MKKLLMLSLLVVLSFCLIANTVSINRNIDVQGQRNPTGPYNLEAQIINYNDVLLYWENPIYLNPPMGFRVFCNGNFVLQINDSDANTCILKNVCCGCHQFYVTAFFDTGSQTAPSNTAEVILTSNQDNVIPGVMPSISVYPNPSRSNVNIAINNAKDDDEVVLSIYNLKGQLIRNHSVRAGITWQWDGKDMSGRKVSEGQYLLKAKTNNGILLQKLRIAK